MNGEERESAKNNRDSITHTHSWMNRGGLGRLGQRERAREGNKLLFLKKKKLSFVDLSTQSCQKAKIKVFALKKSIHILTDSNTQQPNTS